MTTETVYVEITHRIAVTVDRDGWEFRTLPGDATSLISDAIAQRQWGGYSALGVALGNLDPYEATDIRVSPDQSFAAPRGLTRGLPR